MPRDRDAIITGHRIMETSIGNIWTPQVKVHAHVQDMVHSSPTVWLIFKKESGGISDIMTTMMLLIES